MTIRAFIIGLIGVVAFSLLDPFTSFIKGYGYLTASCFPASAVLVLVVLTVGVNVLVKLVRRAWALTQRELMLVWCMMIIGAVIPCEGIGRYWYSLIAGPPYMARRADLYWEDDGSLARAPGALILSKRSNSVAAKQYYEAGGETGRVPWGIWARPLLTWCAFLVPLYLAVFFLCGILRRQWVDVERLMFPLARVPLEFTEGAAASGRLLPSAFMHKGFLLGVLAAGGLRFIRAVPLLLGKDSAMPMAFPLGDVLSGTPLEHANFMNFEFWPPAVGFAFLVPADVSLSVWFFFLFSRAELQLAHEMAWPRAWGTWSPFMSWQQFGCYIAFAGGMVVMARRQLWAVCRAALGMGPRADDAEEPIGYRLAFWGLVVTLIWCVVWHCVHGTRLSTALIFVALLMCCQFVYARIVAQGGLYVSRVLWTMPNIVHGISMGRLFTGPGAVIGQMHSGLLLRGATNMLAPMAMGAFRISSVFEQKRRRWLFPALMVALLVAIPCATYTTLRQGYRHGALNFNDTWSVSDVPRWAFDEADRMIKEPGQSAQPYWQPMAFGAVLTGAVMLLRSRFYWWPIHPIGLLACSSWHAHRLWVPFLLGWLAKVCIMKFSGGRALRHARHFFIGVIIVEGFMEGVSAIVQTASKGAIPGF